MDEEGLLNVFARRPAGITMLDDDMKIVFLLLAFVAVLYGVVRVIDDGPVYRDAPSILAPSHDVALIRATG